ncbi:MAG: hypothetical protein HY720_14070, partial [Planctomycetes bacterium]|nr:hypothetical protein [Planctomycetota bacterium]
MRRVSICMTLLAVATGCGYSVRALSPAGVRTVAVPVFQNVTYRRLVELPLTRAVVKEIQTKTELAVVEEERADSVLQGTIVDVEQRVVTEDLTDRVTEGRITLVVNLTWRDARTGEVILERTGLVESEEFRPVQGENLERAFERGFDS